MDANLQFISRHNSSTNDRRYLVKAKKCYATTKPDQSKMANNLQYHSHICIRWKVKRTNMNAVCRSHPVNYFGKYIVLELMYDTITGLKVYVSHFFVRNDSLQHNIETDLLDKNGAKRYVQKFPFTYLLDKNRERHIQNFPFSEEIPPGSIMETKTEIWSIDSSDFKANVETLFAGDELNIVCVLSVDGECYSKTGKIDSAQKGASLEKLSQDVYKLYRSGQDSDVILKCGDKTIPVHRIILSARSDVFAAMFRSQMAEATNGEVEIPDVRVPILDHLIRYIYSGILDEITGEALVELYEAADKYGVEALKCKCACLLSQELTQDNTCFVLSLAEMHSDHNLKKGVISFILRNKKFLTSFDWIDFSSKNAAFAVEVCNSIFAELNLS